jgi:hypothetical protein
MKPLRIIALLLALAGATLSFTPPAEAALTYTNGDLFLGFRASAGVGATQDYLIRIGSASQFNGVSSSLVVGNIGDLKTNLTAVFGADWSTRDEIFWSVSGANLAADPANTLYATRARVNPATQTLPWLGRSNSSQGVTVSKFNGLIGAYLLSAPAPTNGVATIQNTSDTNSYASYQPGGTAVNSAGISFGAFSPTIEGSLVNGTSGSVLDLYRIVPVFDQPSQYVGNFRLDTDGALIFTPPAATPLARVRIEQAQYSINETDATGQIALKLLRTVGTGAINVNLIASNGTAVAGTDFTAPAVPVAFAEGQLEAVVNIPVANRAGFQGNRTFTVTLGDATAGVVLRTPTSATVTIVESEVNTAGVIAFASGTIDAAATTGGSPSSIALQLTRTNGSTGSVSVDVGVTGGTLVSGTDFEPLTSPATVRFAAGETSKQFSIQLKEIAAGKLPGTIELTLSNPTNGATFGAVVLARVNVTEGIQPLVAGIYSGILAPEAGASRGPGFVSVKVSSNGAFTGKVTIGKASVPITGTIGTDGVAKFNPSKAPSVALSFKGEALGTLALRLSGDRLTGTLKSDATTVVASISTDRAFFDGKTPATTVAAKYLENKGTYTAVIPARGAQPGLDPADYPQGDGYALIKVSPKGVITLKGKLADGTAVSASGALKEDYSVEFYAALYAKLGSLSGELQFDDTQAGSDLSGADLVWVRPVDSKAKHYINGWPAGIAVDLLGASYAVPSKSAPASVIPGLPAADPQAGNATLVFSEGKLSADVTETVNIDSANKASSAPAGDKSFILKITAKTAQISGRFTHTDGSKPGFQGIVYQKGASAGAYGYFLSTVPNGGTPGEAGRVTLIPKQ